MRRNHWAFLATVAFAFPIASVLGAWLYDPPAIRGAPEFMLVLGIVVAGQRLATEVRNRLVAGDDGRSTDGVSRP